MAGACYKQYPFNKGIFKSAVSLEGNTPPHTSKDLFFNGIVRRKSSRSAASSYRHWAHPEKKTRSQVISSILSYKGWKRLKNQLIMPGPKATSSATDFNRSLKPLSTSWDQVCLQTKVGEGYWVHTKAPEGMCRASHGPLCMANMQRAGTQAKNVDAVYFTEANGNWGHSAPIQRRWVPFQGCTHGRG